MRPVRDDLDAPDLMCAVQAGDIGAISRVLDLCTPWLRGMLRVHYGLPREDMEDVLQEVRIAFVQSARRFRGDCSFRFYLSQLAVRKCADFLRSKRRQPAEVHAVDEDRVPMLDDPPFERVLEDVSIGNAMAGLPRREREVVELSLQGMSYKEIAGRMGVAIGTVASTKAEALLKLRAALDAGAENEAGS